MFKPLSMNSLLTKMFVTTAMNPEMQEIAATPESKKIYTRSLMMIHLFILFNHVFCLFKVFRSIVFEVWMFSRLHVMLSVQKGFSAPRVQHARLQLNC
jgi:hypothetical protein